MVRRIWGQREMQELAIVQLSMDARKPRKTQLNRALGSSQKYQRKQPSQG